MTETQKAAEPQPRDYSRKSTIQAMGASLPIGTVGTTGGKAIKDFTLRPWRMAEEKELGRLRAQHQDATLTQYVSMVLATMCMRLGAFGIESMKSFAEKRLAVSQMYMADVYYAYVWLRIQAMGPELALKLKCPFCRTDFNFTGDLNSTEVYVPTADGDKALEWEFKLSQPVSLRGKQVAGFRMGQPRWSALDTADVAQGDSGAGKALVINGSIRGFIGDDTEVVLAPDELDQVLVKRDLERLVVAIDKHMLGPVMSIEAECTAERCKKTWNAPIDWGYDRFFSVSST